MDDTINYLDLSKEEPGSRATVDGLEHIEFGGEMLGSKLSVKAAVTSDSTLYLAVAGSLCVLVLFVIGMGWWAACGFAIPLVYLCAPRRSRT